MAKQKKKLTPAQKREKERKRRLYKWIFINGKQVRVKREPLIDGMSVEDFILNNADPIWLHQNEMWEYITPEVSQNLDCLPDAENEGKEMMNRTFQGDLICVKPPVYLVGKKIFCWRCEAKMSAVSILATVVDEMDVGACLFSNILSLPAEVISYIQKRVPTFIQTYSKTERQKYFANTCPKCNAMSGDFFLYSEPGAPFFPEDEDEAKELFLTEIPISTQIFIDASPIQGVGQLILENAKKIP